MLGAKEIVATGMVMMRLMSFTLALQYNISAEARWYKQKGISMVPKGCPDKCGNVTIYYPFGYGPNKDCYLNEEFQINCTKSSNGVWKPYLSFISNEILGISIDKQIVAIQESIQPTDQSSEVNHNQSLATTQTTNFSRTEESILSYASGYNKLVVIGCGSVVLTSPGYGTVGGCMAMCFKNTELERPLNGINMCELFLDERMKTYEYRINFTHSPVVNACNYVVIADRDWYPQSFPTTQHETLVVPVVRSWTVPRTYLPPRSSSHSCVNQGSYWDCHCLYPKFKGNPYFPNGCQAGRRKLTVKELSAIIGVSASFGFSVLALACCILYKAIKKRKMKKQREKFFKRNGGLLLQQKFLAKEGTIEKAKIFTASELDKATDHFNANRIVGRGGQGTVYKGMLIDGQIIAVKKSQAVDKMQLDSFINEVLILSQINHRNIVKLLGCCLETEVPILVYEFIANGTLFSLIHNNFGDDLIPLSWEIRLRISSEVASALAYLHSATSIPIYHRDVKTTNILLDEKFRAKVSDFGTSRSISIDQTHLTTIVKGTFGYFDPQYFQSSKFTDKSDVYSFGVVLVEILTGQKPISFEVDDDEDRSLVSRFLLCMEESRQWEILDVEVLEQGKKEDVVAFAWLAHRCLNFNGKKRPTMKEVAAELDTIRASHSYTLPSHNENLKLNQIS